MQNILGVKKTLCIGSTKQRMQAMTDLGRILSRISQEELRLILRFTEFLAEEDAQQNEG